MKRSMFLPAAFALAVSAVHIVRAAELQSATLAAWNDYLSKADLRMQDRAERRVPFLWVDESPDRADRLRRGEVVIAAVVGRGSQQVDHGLIHDWIGAVFIPGATLEKALTVVHDYNNYYNVYGPVVASSKMLACSERTQEFQMVWQRKVLFVSAAMQGRYQAHDVTLDAHRGYSVAEAVEMHEIEGYRHADERLLPPDTGNGFIWRIRSMARFEERDGGVYLELEALALTRDVPTSLAWLVNPSSTISPSTRSRRPCGRRAMPLRIRGALSKPSRPAALRRPIRLCCENGFPRTEPIADLSRVDSSGDYPATAIRKESRT